MNTKCAECGRYFEATREDARYCGNTCRSKVHRRRIKAGQELLREQTAAISAGADPAVLAELAREARRLLGD